MKLDDNILDGNAHIKFLQERHQRELLTKIRREWPHVEAAVVGSLNHLLGYPGIDNDLLIENTGASAERIREILEKLLAAGL